MKCKTCKRLMTNGKCAVFVKKFKGCWAWTDDPKWAEKVREAVDKYRKFKNGFIIQYWGD